MTVGGLEKYAVLSADGFWLVTATPMNPGASTKSVLPITVQSVVQYAAETTFPDRTSCSLTLTFTPPLPSSDTGTDPPAMNVVSPPGVERFMNSMPPSGLTSRITSGDP